jgi:hypothetical protein
MIMAMVFTETVGSRHEFFTYFFAKFVFPVRSIAMTGSIYMTLVLAFERYLATSHPITYQRFSSGSIYIGYLKWYLLCVLPVTLFSILFNVPSFFEFSVSYYEDFNSNSTATEHYLTPTELRLNHSYVTYYTNYGKLFFTGIVPFLGLLFFNIMVFLQMKKLMRFSDQSRSQKEYELARVLVVIVLVFLICHIPRLGLNLYESIYSEMPEMFPTIWMMVCLAINKLFLAINSSVNVVIYGCLNKKFRSAMFCKRNNLTSTEYNLEETNEATQIVELPSHVEVI